MAISRWDARFFESTRGRILTMIRQGGGRTVDDLASTLGVSDNAVRPHIAALEANGLIRQRDVRRPGPAGGKPAYLYEITPEAERIFSRAYLPLLAELVSVLAERVELAKLTDMLREVGRRLAPARGRASGSSLERAQAAAAVLTELGGVVDVESREGGLVLAGRSCPLAELVRVHPVTCQAAESLVAQVVGGPVREVCEKGERPRCRFELFDPEGPRPDR